MMSKCCVLMVFAGVHGIKQSNKERRHPSQLSYTSFARQLQLVVDIAICFLFFSSEIHMGGLKSFSFLFSQLVNR